MNAPNAQRVAAALKSPKAQGAAAAMQDAKAWKEASQ